MRTIKRDNLKRGKLSLNKARNKMLSKENYVVIGVGDSHMWEEGAAGKAFWRLLKFSVSAKKYLIITKRF